MFDCHRLLRPVQSIARVLAAASVLIGPALAATGDVRSTPALVSSPADPSATAAYTLGPGDQISIHVMELDDVSDKAVRVDPAGVVDLPLIGRVQAGDMTVEQFRAELSRKLGKYIENPQITINVLEYRSQPVSILGAVNTPGVQQLQGPKRLLEVISMAGGLKAEAGSKLTITRPIKWGAIPVPGSHADSSGQYSMADISIDDLTTTQDPRLNIYVRPNDTITVPKADIVYVLGQVKRAGGFPITSHDSISLMKALALAQGLDHDAAPKNARILRATDAHAADRHETPVNLQQILQGKAPDLDLHADDVLYIPDSVSRSATRRAMETALQVATGVVIYRR